MTFHFDAEAYCRQAAERRARLMNPPVAKKAPIAVIAKKPDLPPAGKPNWYAPPKPFRAHIDAYKMSSRFAKTPLTYLQRRAVELGFTPKEVVGGFILGPYVEARRIIAYELAAKFGLTPHKIGQLLKRDHSSIYQLFKKAKPTEAEGSMRLVLGPGKTFMLALEQDYYDGVMYSEISAKFRITTRSIANVAERMGWPKRNPKLSLAGKLRYQKARS
jgi:plasmid maintenance system antidote protein VapI